MIWLYGDTKDAQKIITLSQDIFWAVLPSLLFFVVLPLLLKSGINFWLSMILSAVAMFLAYSVYVYIASGFGIRL